MLPSVTLSISNSQTCATRMPAEKCYYVVHGPLGAALCQVAIKAHPQTDPAASCMLYPCHCCVTQDSGRRAWALCGCAFDVQLCGLCVPNGCAKSKKRGAARARCGPVVRRLHARPQLGVMAHRREQYHQMTSRHKLRFTLPHCAVCGFVLPAAQAHEVQAAPGGGIQACAAGRHHAQSAKNMLHATVWGLRLGAPSPRHAACPP